MMVEEGKMKFLSYSRVALATTLNIVLNAATWGRCVWLEGRIRRGVFTNWARRFRYRPERFRRPTSEEEIIELISDSESLRVFGAGHSFNEGVVSDDTLVSLDGYSGTVQREDLGDKQIAVKGGTRVRRVVEMLFERGLAFEALPSHDAQSIAGILSTDVHGTGRDWGFVSESVVCLKLVDGNGEVHECEPKDDLFKAAVGGIGAVGIVTEAVVQGVDRFNVQQRVQTADLSSVEKNLDRLLQNNEHLSLYLFPFADKCQINTWNFTLKNCSLLGDVREFIIISADALLAAWVGNLIAYTGLLRCLSPLLYRLKLGSNLVLESNKSFNRTIYHLHQELEFTVPFEDAFEVVKYFKELYEQLYEETYPSALPYTLFEVRFTPEHNRTLIGAGRGRRSAWIDLVCNDSYGFEEYYAEAQKLIKEIGARPHLGKYCEAFGKSDMEKLHGDSFAKFLDLVEKHDPEAKFANELTRRLFGNRIGRWARGSSGRSKGPASKAPRATHNVEQG
jgi:hypothetical protein